MHIADTEWKESLTEKGNEANSDTCEKWISIGSSEKEQSYNLHIRIEGLLLHHYDAFFMKK